MSCTMYVLLLSYVNGRRKKVWCGLGMWSFSLSRKNILNQKITMSIVPACGKKYDAVVFAAATARVMGRLENTEKAINHITETYHPGVPKLRVRSVGILSIINATI